MTEIVQPVPASDSVTVSNAGGGDRQAAASAPTDSPIIISPDVSGSSSPVDAAVVATPTGEVSSDAPIEPATPADDPSGAADTVLGGTEKADVAKAPDAKPADKVEGEAKPDAKPADVKVETPVYEEFKLPENYTADKESMSEFTKVLGELETAKDKLDHKGYQEAGQKLIDLGTKAINQSVTRLNEYYTQIHNEQKAKWFDAFKADPEIGGNSERIMATTSNVRDALNQYGGSKEQIEEIRSVMKDSGVGNNPSIIRLIHNMNNEIKKYTTEGDANRMVPAGKPAPTKVQDHQILYRNG